MVTVSEAMRQEEVDALARLTPGERVDLAMGEQDRQAGRCPSRCIEDLIA